MRNDKAYVFRIICTPPENEWDWQHSKMKIGGKEVIYQTLRLSHEMGEKIKQQLNVTRKGVYKVERFSSLNSDFSKSIKKYLEIYTPQKAYVLIQ